MIAEHGDVSENAPMALDEVRAVLAEQRGRGVPFADAWPLALHSAPAGWRRALDATSEAWRSAYEGHSPRREPLEEAWRELTVLRDTHEPIPGPPLLAIRDQRTRPP
jgi:hypothetical protein